MCTDGRACVRAPEHMHARFGAHISDSKFCFSKTFCNTCEPATVLTKKSFA